MPTKIPTDNFKHFVTTNLELISMHLVDTIFENFAMVRH